MGQISALCERYGSKWILRSDVSTRYFPTHSHNVHKALLANDDGCAVSTKIRDATFTSALFEIAPAISASMSHTEASPTK